MWNEKMETLSTNELRKIQSDCLQKTVERVYNNVSFYRRKFDEAGIKPEDIKGVEDLARLPFTTKQDLRDNYPYQLFAVPMEEVEEIHASSGTTGKMTVVGYTRHDLDVWGEIAARTLGCGGTTRNDFVQVSYGYGLFTGGLGMHYGTRKMGATVIPTSGGNTKRQLQVMTDFGTTTLACTPSYAMFLAEAAHEGGIDLTKLNLKRGFFGAEPWSDNMRKEIEKKWGIKAYDIYGLSEIMGPGVSSECSAQQGLHVWEDHFIVEVINPVTGEVLPDGAEGELVFTCITKEALPLIRYRTRDISILNHEPCSCGRTHVRMHRVMGRTDDMLIIRGVNVFPSQIESVLLDIGETEPHYQLIVDREGNLDDLEIWVEVSERLFSDKVRKLEELEGQIRREILSTLGISAKIKLVEPKTIERSEGKAKRIIDRRDVYKSN